MCTDCSTPEIANIEDKEMVSTEEQGMNVGSGRNDRRRDWRKYGLEVIVSIHFAHKKERLTRVTINMYATAISYRKLALATRRI
jgi:hypothetical protein